MKKTTLEKEIISGFHQGRIPSDKDFDRLLPLGIRSRSSSHWTPVAVANMISRFLAPTEHSRVLDIGSGCGKFCVVGALSSPGQFYGIEQKKPLFESAVSLAERLEQDRAKFILDDAFSQDWNDYSALYFYNPFGEALFTPNPFNLLLAVSATPHQFELFVAATIEKLEGLPAGVRVATYHGFGGYFPASFRQIHSMNIGRGTIEIWMKELRHEKA